MKGMRLQAAIAGLSVVVMAGAGALVWRSGVEGSAAAESDPSLLLAQTSVFETPSLGPTFEPLRQNRPDFFEVTQEQIDQEIANFQDNRSAPTFGLSTGFLAWQPAVFRNGGFTVWMPPGVFTEELEVIEGDEMILEFDVFAVHTATSRFVVGYAERPETVEDAEVLFESIQSAAVERTAFQLGESRPASLEANPGVEVELTDDSETIALRILLSDERVYIVGIRQPMAAVASDTAAAFLNSFQLL